MEDQGTEQPRRYCRNCGAELRPDVRFCVSCGVDIDQSTAASESEPGPTNNASPGLLASLINRMRAAVDEVRRRDRSVSPSVSLEGFRNVAGRAATWLMKPPALPKIAVCLALLLIFMVVLSPIVLVIFGLAFLGSVVVLCVRIHDRAPVAGWGWLAVSSLLVILTSWGISQAVYGAALWADGESGGNSQANDGSGSPNELGGAGGQYADVTLSDEEEDYIEAVVDAQSDMSRLLINQARLYDACVQGCSSELRNETMEGMATGEDLYLEAADFAPPTGYEESYEVWISGMDSTRELARSVGFNVVSPSEFKYRQQELVDQFAEARQLMPSEGQSHFVTYVKQTAKGQAAQ